MCSGGRAETLRLCGTEPESIVDGPGFRFVVFVQGCPHGCPGCHNPQSQPFDGGYEVTVDELYQAVADLVETWGEETRGESGYSAVGAVVGATYPQQGIELRARMPHAFFLVPGYGTQGAKGTDIAGCFDANGNGAIVNASRSILCAWKKREGMAFDAAAREEALRMKEDLASSLAAVGKAIQ